MKYLHSGCSTQWNGGIWWSGHCLWCKKVKPVDAVDAVHSGIVIYGGGDIVQKGETSGFAGHSHTVDTVQSGCSECSTQ